jgi:Fe-S cluster assembly protein SufB
VQAFDAHNLRAVMGAVNARCIRRWSRSSSSAAPAVATRPSRTGRPTSTTGTITSKSISKAGGRTSYRGHVKIYPGAHNAKSLVKCDALLLDEDSISDTYPYIDVDENDVSIAHEATVSKVSDEQLFYLMSRGIPLAEAETMIVNGFIEPFTKELPLEYAIELNRLIQLEMEGSVG